MSPINPIIKPHKPNKPYKPYKPHKPKPKLNPKQPPCLSAEPRTLGASAAIALCMAFDGGGQATIALTGV